MKRWVARAIVSMLMKFYPAKDAGSGQIFPSKAYGSARRDPRRRLRNCFRYVDCTKNAALQERTGRRRA